MTMHADTEDAPSPSAAAGTRTADIAIVGGSYVGLTLALALVSELGPEIRIAVVDRASAAAAQAVGEHDPRASAISAASRNLLQAIGLWATIEAEATPIAEIELTDSSLRAALRRPLLTYDNSIADADAGVGRQGERQPASYIVPNSQIAAALLSAVARSPAIRRIDGVTVTGFAATSTAATIQCGDGSCLQAALVVAADGRRSAVRELAGIRTVNFDHGQVGIVTALRHELDHGNRAIQHFLPGGPFALLPLRGGHRSCVTWSETAREAERILALDDGAFLHKVEVRVAGRLGALTLDGRRRSWPLETHLARRFVGQRLALVGDAAHGVHPIAGQGLNLGFRDVAALVECVADAARVGLDFGCGDTLARYERWRRFDTALSAATFSGLNRLFSNDLSLVRSAREVGLGVLDRLPGIKRLFVDEAAGLGGTIPRLLRPAHARRPI